MVLWRPTRPSRTNTKKEVFFIRGNWNAKVGSQEIPGVTGKFSLGVQNEPGERLTEICQEKELVIANTLFQQHKQQHYTCISPDGQYQVSLIIFFPVENGEALYSQKKKKKRQDTNCDSGHEILIAKFRLKLKEVGKTTRPFRYDLN